MEEERGRNKRAALILIPIAVVFLGAYGLSRMRQQPPTATLAPLTTATLAPPTETAVSEATLTPDPDEVSYPITTTQIAISASLLVFPPGHEPINTVARLIYYGSLDRWRGPENASIGMEPQAPVWLVGVLGSNLDVGDAVDWMESKDGGKETIEGLYYAWDANSGTLIGTGALGKQWPQTFQSISDLQDEKIPIVAATPYVEPDYPSDLAPAPTFDSTPTP